MDVMDTYTPTDSDISVTISPYVRGRHRGRPMNLSYTEEVAGSVKWTQKLRQKNSIA